MTSLKGLRQITPYLAGKQPCEKDMIKLNTNENAYDPSPAVLQALKNFDGRQLRKYSSLTQTELVEELADHLQLSPDQIIVGNGSDDILSLAFLSFFNSQEPVLFPNLTYGFYKVWADLYRVPFEEIPLRDNFEIDFEDYKRDNGGIIIANPNAPTGIVKSLVAVENLLEANPRSIVIIDEAYINFGGQSAVPLLAKHKNLFITRTFSKDASLAGLRVGYGIASPALIAVIKAVRDSVNPYNVDSLAEALATAAVKDWAYYEDKCRRIIETREWFKDELIALGFSVLPSATNFLLVKPARVSSSQLFNYLEERHIYVRYFPKVAPIKDYLRISIGTDSEMARVIQTIKELCDE